MTPEQIDAITKARLVTNISRKADEQFADNDSYVAWVCEMANIVELPESAVNSYADQHSNITISELEVELALHLAPNEDTPDPEPVVELPSDLLAAAKITKRNEINAARKALENGTSPSPLGAVQCDNDSRNKINGAVLMAMLSLQAGESFNVGWTMADNTNIDHDAMAMISMGKAVGTYIATLHAIGVYKKSLVDAATTVQEVNDVNVFDGWPV